MDLESPACCYDAGLVRCADVAPHAEVRLAVDGKLLPDDFALRSELPRANDSERFFLHRSNAPQKQDGIVGEWRKGKVADVVQGEASVLFRRAPGSAGKGVTE